MNAMSLRELMTYLQSLPKDTYFPIGLGTPFLVNNMTEKLVFSPALSTTAEKMVTYINKLIGLEVRSSTGARSIINLDSSFTYFGLDDRTVLTPLNIVFLTVLRAMMREDMKVIAELGDGRDDVVVNVPSIWWNTLTKQHQKDLITFYIGQRVLKDVNIIEVWSDSDEGKWKVATTNCCSNNTTSAINGVELTDAFGKEIDINCC